MEQAMLVQVAVAQAMNWHRLTVVPIICVGNRTVSGDGRAGGVLVLDTKSIAKRLADEPLVLSDGDVQELAQLLDEALPPYDRRS
jgi:tetraacyldisaccharide-1-P 4'-kinase